MKLRRAVGLLLAVILFTGLLPVTAVAVEADKKSRAVHELIDGMSLSIEVPEVGTVITCGVDSEGYYDFSAQEPKPDVAITDANVDYFIDADGDYPGVYWIDQYGEGFTLFVNTEDDPYMVEGREYRALVQIRTTDGHAFVDEPEIDIEGGRLIDAVVTMAVYDENVGTYVATAYDIIIGVRLGDAGDEYIDSVELTITPPLCGTVVTAEEELDVRGEPGMTYDWNTQDPYPAVTVDEDAPYELDEEEGEDGYLYGYWLEKIVDGEDENYVLYVNWEEHPCMVGGDEVYAEVWLRVKDGATIEFPDVLKSEFVDEVDITVHGGTLVDYYFSEGNQYLCMLIEVEVEHIPGDPVSENEVAPKCLEDGSHDLVTHCEACGAELDVETLTDPALGHDWGEWEVVKEPEVGVAGEERRVCKRDPSHVETRPIDPLEENPDTGDSLRPALWTGTLSLSTGALMCLEIRRRRRSLVKPAKTR